MLEAAVKGSAELDFELMLQVGLYVGVARGPTGRTYSALEFCCRAPTCLIYCVGVHCIDLAMVRLCGDHLSFA